jgi:hypothetical protein
MPKRINREADNFGNIMYEWSFDEYEKYTRGRKWYIIAGIVGLLLLAYALISGINSFALIVVFYCFHPDAFGIILMRSKNTKKYANYYNLCQKCIKYHSKYQVELKNSEVSRMINKLTEQNEKLDKSNKKLEESNKRSEKLEIKLDKSNEKLDESNKKLDESNKKLDKLYNENKNLQDKLNIIEKKLDKATDTRIILHKKKNENENFLLFKNKYENKYYCSRILKKDSSCKIKEMNGINYELILTINDIPNSKNTFKHFKEDYKKEISFNSNYFSPLNNYNEDDMIEIITKLYEKRKDV